MLDLGVDYPTPYLLIDLDKIREKYRNLKSALSDADIFYAMKANPEARIVATLLNEGCGVEVTSQAELSLTLGLGARPDQIISSNPIKEPRFLQALHGSGIGRMVFDSTVEVDKIAQYAPHSRVYLRIKTDNSGSDWPLSNKFGVDAADAPGLLQYAASQGLTPYGLTFHVGSQCRNPQNWITALRSCAWVMDKVASSLQLEVINLGGGLPIQHTKPIPELYEILSLVTEARKTLFSDRIRFLIEPGRFLVGDSATLVSSVIGKARRNGEHWLYLDVGVYNGLMETIENFAYEFDFNVESTREKGRFTIAGPSCDSMDTMFTGQSIPDLQLGERFYILNAGAYTSSYASHFNGFPLPRVLYTEELQATSYPGMSPAATFGETLERLTTVVPEAG